MIEWHAKGGRARQGEGTSSTLCDSLHVLSSNTVTARVTEHAGALCQNFDIYKREAEYSDRVADKWGNCIYFSISQTSASKTEIDLLPVLILQFCKQYNLKTVSTSPKFCFQFHLLKLLVTFL